MHLAPVKKGINLNLEALRGFAALFVVLNHIEALHNAFNPGYMPTATIVLAPNGRLFVLVFFVLSGYVIGLNHSQPMRGADIKTYIRKRLTRIYPIYFAALVFTLFVAQTNYPVGIIVINFLMLHMLLGPPFNENGPAWSLHYEMVYYGLFILISRFKLNTPLLIIISVILALGGAGMFSSYFLGLSFWLSGLLIAQRLNRQEAGNTSYRHLAAAVFILLALDQLLARPGLPNLINYLSYNMPGANLLIGRPQASPLVRAGHDLIYLPIYAFIVILFTGKPWRYTQVCFNLLNALILVAIMATVWQYLNGYTSHIKVYLISVVYYIIALLLWFTNWTWFEGISRTFIRIGTWLGGISYGLYIIHAPVIFLMGRVVFPVQNQQLNYGAKLLLFFIMVVPAAWLLEKHMQPFIKKLLKKGD